MVAITERRAPASGLVEIEAGELRAMLERGEALVVDVREPEEFAREHIEGAVLMPLSKLDPAKVPADDGRMVVLHCRSGARSTRAAQMLLGSGRGVVRHLKGGIVAWRGAGCPVVENRRIPISVMRQVQITAGSMVVIFTVLGAAVSPWFLALGGFVGAGLVFAGCTGTCGMATLLGKMPWNRVARGESCCGGPQASST